MNKIEYLDLFTGIEKITIYNTKIRELKGLNSLIIAKSITIGFNRYLTAIDEFLQFNQLESLFLNHNGLSYLPSLTAPRMKSFSFAGGQISDMGRELDKLDAPLLEDLTLTDSAIVEIPNIGRFHELRCLRLSGNRITKLDGIEECKKLRVLYVDNNPIVDITSISKLRSLEFLSIDDAVAKKNPWLKQKVGIDFA